VSFDDKHLALLEYAVTALDEGGDVTLSARIVDRQVGGGAQAATDGAVSEASSEAPTFDPRKSEDMRGALLPERHGVVDTALGGVAAEAADAAATRARTFLAHATSGSRLGVAVMVEHVLDGAPATVRTTTTPRSTGTPCRSNMSRAWYSNRSTLLHPSSPDKTAPRQCGASTCDGSRDPQISSRRDMWEAPRQECPTSH